MSLKIYIWGVGVITIFFLILFSFIVFKTNPDSRDFIIIIAFWGSLYFSLAGIFTLFGYFTRSKLAKGQVIVPYFKSAIRQALLLALVMIGLLVLRAAGVLNWWDGLIITGAILLLEIYFRGK